MDMYRYGVIFILLTGLMLAGCETKQESAQIIRCKQACASSPVLMRLNPKVVYKPIKLCKKRCQQTEGTCSDKPGQWMQIQQCIFFGVNAGRPPGTKGHLLQ